VAYRVDDHDDFIQHDEERPARKGRGQSLFGGLALAGIAVACGWTLYVNIAGSPDAIVAPTVTIVTAKKNAPAETVVEKNPAARTEPSLLTAPRFDSASFDANPVLPAAPFAQNAPMKSALQVGPAVARRFASAPLPTPRPAEVAQVQKAPVPKPQRGGYTLASAESAPAATTIFEKIFGKADRPAGALAYASLDGGVFNDGQSKSVGKLPANTDGVTAVYDITARTVYMPDGTKLEAHSGLRDKLDNPRYVNVRMWGPTPPHTYDLIPREALFHGVEAIRLIPVGGEGAIFGRSGLLAHTYMLGPKGDSNGCVSFKDYGAFLRAFKAGKVKRMVVVASGGLTALASNN
jgi:hypothetical protein